MENEENKDLLAEEISEYYKNIPDDTFPDGCIEEKTIEQSNTSMPIVTPNPDTADEFAVSENDKENIEDDTFLTEEKQNSKMFFIVSAAIAAAVLLSVFFAGILSYKDEEDVNYKFSHMQTSSKKYANAQERINLINEEITELEDEIAEKQTELNTITEYESNTGEIKSKQNVLNANLKELQNTEKNKEKQLSDLESSVKSKIPTMITLTPGLYTVGENLISGNYNAVGDGAIVVSSASGGAKINTSLNSDAISFTLENGDIIKLETKAVFSRIQ